MSKPKEILFILVPHQGKARWGIYSGKSEAIKAMAPELLLTHAGPFKAWQAWENQYASIVMFRRMEAQERLKYPISNLVTNDKAIHEAILESKPAWTVKFDTVLGGRRKW